MKFITISILFSQTHLFAVSGLRNASTDVTATTSGCPNTSFLFSHTTHSATNQVSKNDAHGTQQTCVLLVYIFFGKATDHSHWFTQTFDQHFIWPTQYDTLVTIITQCITLVTIYV